MSHMVSMKSCPIKSLKALAAAASVLGMKMHFDRKEAQYYANQRMKCDAVISMPGSTYEIAVIAKPGVPGEYELQADLYDQKLKAKVGDKCEKLTNVYGVEAVKEEVMAQGNAWDVTEQWSSDFSKCELTLTQ